MAQAKTQYICTECGYQAARWLGKCPECGSWGTLEEAAVESAPKAGLSGARAKSVYTGPDKSQPIDDVKSGETARMVVGIDELDRVLGGGIVPGSLVLLGGDPGIGKSTLLLQACARIAQTGETVLYVSAEESARQIKMRADRLGIRSTNLRVLAETDMDTICHHIEEIAPALCVVDSIQTVYKSGVSSMSGSVSQVRQCAGELMRVCKSGGGACFLVGHVTKEGALAGPRVLEHMVDAVLYFEGDRRQEYRILRAAKNRFGSINEIGVFTMGDSGIHEVKNPSEFFLSTRAQDAAGSVVACTIEGTRPILVDLQALVAQTVFPAPRRQSYGFDHQRLALLLAVMEKRAGFKLYNMDVYTNVAGGMELDEPAADLPLVAAVASSLSGLCVPQDMVIMGEVGLTGEVRAISNIGRRVSECARMGFTTCVVPKNNLKAAKAAAGDITIIGVSTIREALGAILGGKEKGATHEN